MTARPGHGGPSRAAARTPASASGPTVAERPAGATAAAFRVGAADGALRAVLARLGRHRDPAVRAAAEEIAADAAAALLALAERGEQLAPRRGGPRPFIPPNHVDVALSEARSLLSRAKYL